MSAQIIFLLGLGCGLAAIMAIRILAGIFGNRISGVLKIDHSNPEKDIYRFEFYKFVDLSKKKQVIIKVDNNADLSQN